MTSSGFPAPPCIPFDVTDLLRRIEARLRQLPATLDEGAILSVKIDTPELVHISVDGLSSQDLYWARPGTQTRRIGVGQAVMFATMGRDRLARLAHALHRLQNAWSVHGPDASSTDRLAFLGFAFDPHANASADWTGLPNAMLCVPDVVYEQDGAECSLTFSVAGTPDFERACVRGLWLQRVSDLVQRLITPRPQGQPPALAVGKNDQQERIAKANWHRRVNHALEAIARGEINKVVLARRKRITTRDALAPGSILSWLESRYPDCAHFAVPVGKKTLVGVTPERLIRFEAGAAVVDAIAGTSARDPALRHSVLTQDMFNDCKLREEHDHVVNAIQHVLQPVSSHLVVPEHPHLLSLPNVDHLWSPIHAKIHPQFSLLDLADRLHPTPAIGGAPRDAARDWLRKRGETWRGWYTGALGWISAHGEGELQVVLRCALLDRYEAVLFAGAGIVSDSDPHQEYIETEWKLKTMLDALSYAV